MRHKIKILFYFKVEPVDPCNPSPCQGNGQCRIHNGAATCIYPECVINQDCPRDKACFGQKCRDPCSIDACGINALCNAINHKAVCTCPPGYVGSPHIDCRLQIIEDGKKKNKINHYFIFDLNHYNLINIS